MRKLCFLVVFSSLALLAQPRPWPPHKASEWYARQPWIVGANYTPSSAVNQLEMWQAETFDPRRIDTELGWAEHLGMNSMRVFLHDLLWQQDPEGYKKRIKTYLEIAARRHIRTLFVLFDSCWDPFPQLGPQRAPKPGVHNSGWVQSPGAAALRDPAQYGRLAAYVKGVVGTFARDRRVLGWDIWNEPGTASQQEPSDKNTYVLKLLAEAFRWAREARPTQPLTSALWQGADWSSLDKLTPIERVQVEQSDVISFHNYEAPAEFEKRARWLGAYQRPVLCTEYMARVKGSTFQGILPIAKRLKIAAYNWGLVAGKTQTNLPWDSWQRPYTDREPAVWLHDVFRADGRPYRIEEVEFLRQITGRKK